MSQCHTQRNERKLRRDEMKAHKKSSSQTPGIVSFPCKRPKKKRNIVIARAIEGKKKDSLKEGTPSPMTQYRRYALETRYAMQNFNGFVPRCVFMCGFDPCVFPLCAFDNFVRIMASRVSFRSLVRSFMCVVRVCRVCRFWGRGDRLGRIDEDFKAQMRASIGRDRRGGG